MSEIPFGAPPVGFMQAGNQVMIDNQNPFDAQKIEQGLGPIPDNNKNDFNEFSSENVESDLLSLPTFEKELKTPNSIQKYYIFDLFWMLNPKFSKKIQLQPNEAQFVVVSFNISFGNLRISFFELTNNSIQKNIIYLENLKKTVNGTIYPSTAFNAFNSPRVATVCMEQLFRQIQGASWQLERPICKIEKNEVKLRFTISDPKLGNYFYDFEDWQYAAFLRCLEFCFTKGFELVGRQHINNN